MTEASLTERITAILLIEDIGERNHELHVLAAHQDSKSMEAFDAIIPFLTSSNETLRRRAGSALGRFPEQVGHRENVLIEHLLHNSNPSVRSSCAITLMRNLSAPVTLAYRCALDDSSDQVVRLACSELGFRAGKENAEALIPVLSHRSWHVRLQACQALITQGVADRRVVETLEAMNRDPEARTYDAECDDFEMILRKTSQESGETPPFKMWGKLNTILEQARNLAGPEQTS